jgi:hypothetical protein
MHDFAATLALTISNGNRQLYFDLYRHIERWRCVVFDCVDNYTLLEAVDSGIFVTEYTETAIKQTMQMLNANAVPLDNLYQALHTHSNVVGRLHKIYQYWVELNKTVKDAIEQLLSIVVYVVDSYMKEIYCALPIKILKYIESTIYNYINWIQRMEKGQHNFYVSPNNLSIQAMYLYGQLASSGTQIDVLDWFKSNNINVDRYILAIPKVVSNIVHNTNVSGIVPILADHFLRCANATRYNIQLGLSSIIH